MYLSLSFSLPSSLSLESTKEKNAEENMHFVVAGILCREGVKSFASATTNSTGTAAVSLSV